MSSDKDVALEKEKAIKCLRQLRNLLTDDLNLKSPIHDEKFLLRFVRAKKYDATLAYETVRKYFRMRRKFPDVFNNCFPSHTAAKELIESRVIAKLKHKDPEGRIMIMMNTLPWNPEKHSLDDVMIAMVLTLEELPPSVQLEGMILLYDKDGFNFSHAKEYSIHRIKTALNIWQGSIPIRLKGAHIVREGKAMDVVLAAVRPFMKEKLKNRLHLHGTNLDSLVNLIGADRLPKHFGGNLTDEEAYDDNFNKQIFNNDAYYKGLLEYGLGEGCSDDEDTYM